MAYKDKVLRLLVGVKTKQQMKLLWEYFNEKNIDIGEDHFRTSLYIYSRLPDGTTTDSLDDNLS